MQGRSGRFIKVKITLFHRCHQRHTLASHKVTVTIIFLLHLMLLTDILGFDLAVRCHLLSLALPGLLVFFSISSFPPLHSRVVLLHFTILSPSPFSCLPLSTFPLSPPRSRNHRFCVCLPDGGRKRSRKFICRDVAPYSKTRMIYLHGAEGETDEMDLLEKGLSSVTRRGGGET